MNIRSCLKFSLYIQKAGLFLSFNSYQVSTVGILIQTFIFNSNSLRSTPRGRFQSDSAGRLPVLSNSV